MSNQNENFQFRVTLDVRMLMKWNISYADGAVFFYLINCTDWAETISVDGVEYRWVSLSMLAQQVPLSAPSIRTLQRTIRTLRKIGVIETTVVGNKNMIRITEKGLAWNGKADNLGELAGDDKNVTPVTEVSPSRQKRHEGHDKNGTTPHDKNGTQLDNNKISIQGMNSSFVPSDDGTTETATPNDDSENVTISKDELQQMLNEAAQAALEANAETSAPEPEPAPTLHEAPQLELVTPPQKPKKKNGYTEEFEIIWKAYPKRAGGNPKKSAFKAYNARRKEGVTHDELLAGVERYNAYAKAEGKEGTEYIMHGSTFFGPNERWKDEYATKKQRPRTPVTKEDFENTDYGPAPVFPF